MRPEQRRKVVTQFDKATMKSKRILPLGSEHALASTLIVTEQPSEKKSVSPEESGITKLTTLLHMWQN